MKEWRASLLKGTWFSLSISEHFRNVYRRNKAIMAFSKDVKVILLGLKSAASGTNLTQATHIVLMGNFAAIHAYSNTQRSYAR